MKAGAGLQFLDVGGGLGIDYDGSQTNFESSVNYTLEEYANDVVYHIQTVCDDAGVKHPTIVSESGRAVVAYHSILIFNVLGVSAFGEEKIPDAISPDEAEQPVIDLLEKHGVELVCLAGYMRLLSPAFVAAFAGRILNVHPALLPAFPGLRAQRQALAHGVKVTGATVHLVDEGTDTGPIVLQAAVPVLEEDTEDTLAARILVEEHRLFPDAIWVHLVRDVQYRFPIMRRDNHPTGLPRRG